MALSAGPTLWAHDADQNGLDAPEEQAAATGPPLRSGLDSEAMLRVHWRIESRPQRELPPCMAACGSFD